ncbi:MAG: hypothetical protein JXA21_18805 [Anaerolineae bacterium]|nr:hypothetical protein [Anaerolineae bacterium]
MPPRYFANVTCPSCGNRFQTPVQQILDVRVNPEAKNRVMSGMVNGSTCPACGTSGPLNLPFIYHDPEKDVALLYLPVGLGHSEEERQKAAGTLARQLMDSLPMEERKGYLLQPETFISMETLVKRVLELEGVTEADLEHNRQQREFLDTFFNATQEEWESLLAQNEGMIDEAFFSMLQYTLQVMAMAGPEGADFQKFREVYDFIVANSALGRLLTRRTEVISVFSENPSRESLVQALAEAPDDGTLYVLVQSGLPLLDYAFFQRLLKRIDEAGNADEKERLTNLRRRILEIRDEISQAAQKLMMERGGLLEKMVKTEDVSKMVRSHLSELDDTFSLVLRTELEEAQRQNNAKMVERLQEVARVLTQVMEENMPPEMVLARRLLMSPTDEQERQLLEQNQALLTPQFFQLLENLESNSREEGNEEVAAQIAKLRAVAQQYAPQTETLDETTAGPVDATGAPFASKPAPTPAVGQTPSGLIIAKH